jgi:hypothetical protein
MRKLLMMFVCLSLPAVAEAQKVPSSFTPIQPCRLFDSRELPGGQPLTNGVTYQIAVRGECGVPETANAVFLTAVSTGATAAGFVKIWASDLLPPDASTFNFRGNGDDSSSTFARLCAPPLLECSEVDLSFRIAFTPTHLILDVAGYTEPLGE